MTPFEYIIVFIAAIFAGGVNALAGGGTLLTFPVLMGVGLPAVAANITNSVALLPGYLGATYSQRKDLAGQGRRLVLGLPAAAVGGLAGGILLLNTGEELFQDLVPFLILGASLLLAAQDWVRGWLTRRSKDGSAHLQEAWIVLPIGLAAVYGGYFGAGLSVIVLAVIGLVIEDNLTRLNAIKQLVGFVTNFAAVLFFVFSGQVVWSAALVMMVGALLGGALGGKLAGRVKPATLRMIVVTVGILVSIVYFIK
jgi:uncharacterized membrane protein YfcA